MHRISNGMETESYLASTTSPLRKPVPPYIRVANNPTYPLAEFPCCSAVKPGRISRTWSNQDGNDARRKAFRRLEGTIVRRAPSFEHTLGRLEEIVRLLEEGKIGLDEALARYEEGVGLLRKAYELLEGAQRRISLLSGWIPREILSCGRWRMRPASRRTWTAPLRPWQLAKRPAAGGDGGR